MDKLDAMQAFTRVVTTGSFAEAGRKLFDQAAREPSQVMLLIARVIKSRQTELAGHPRVAVYCQSTTQLRILHGYLYGEDMGELFVFGARSCLQVLAGRLHSASADSPVNYLLLRSPLPVSAGCCQRCFLWMRGR